ncbi:M23 family metallopeptidase [Streptomyces sp. NBC_00690]|uniref:M23 family metallopeptidase n=1 Tax=Streptomyces sp. NBC_00690 TaxID=2975808 RepID=UPI002E2804D5|nr:M23 family metallopeptidase [Streptomyces sp. NBC_00690]
MPARTNAPAARRRKLLLAAYRTSWLAFVALLLVSVVLDPFHWAWVFPPAALAIAVMTVLNRTAGAAHSAARPDAVEVAAPVTGRWLALNSPADKVPSHGTHAYGQTYAIDIVAEGPDPAIKAADPAIEARPTTRPEFTWFWPLLRRNSAFPAFGAPLLAVADATVVAVRDRQRDHHSRTSLPMLVYLMLIEAFFRDVFGPSRIIGNRVVLDLGDGTYALYAHVQRGSISVREGERVHAGQEIARCGNSGNSTEPHVHFQLMDDPDPDIARGVPFRWRGIGIPANNESFTAGPGTDDASTDAAAPADGGEWKFTVTD